MFHVQNESRLVLNKCLDVLVAHTTSKQPGDLKVMWWMKRGIHYPVKRVYIQICVYKAQYMCF